MVKIRPPFLHKKNKSFFENIKTYFCLSPSISNCFIRLVVDYIFFFVQIQLLYIYMEVDIYIAYNIFNVISFPFFSDITRKQ